MDKYEYKIRSEEIKTLIARGEYAEAASIADEIDWRRVKSVMMLCTISDLYKINRRFEDSRDLLLLAYERHPGGRSIVYSLCELSIKMEEFVQAVEYYKEFVQVAPKDSGRYVLQYKLYEAQDVSLEERIAVLEELKTKDYTEKWAYELAYLYHRVGLATRCVEECDELILWFGEGKYVVKAMELKMLHEPLSSEQQKKYDEVKGTAGTGRRISPAAGKRPVPVMAADAPTQEIPSRDMDIEVKLMGVGQYDTINMQKELAENMKELWEGTEAGEEPDMLREESYAPTEETDMEDPDAYVSIEETEEEEGEETDTVLRTIIAPMMDETGALDVPDEESLQEEKVETRVEEVFFGETAEMDTTAEQVMEAIRSEAAQPEEPQALKPPTKFEKILGMEYDGQISLLLPEAEQIEKQITGQLKLEDILSEWERMKKDSEQKRREAVRQRVMEQTGAMFTEFEASMRDGLLEKLESNKAAAAAETAGDIIAGPLTEEVLEETDELPDSEVVDMEELEAIEVIEDIEALEELEEDPEEKEAEDIFFEEEETSPVPEDGLTGMEEPETEIEEDIQEEILEEQEAEEGPAADQGPAGDEDLTKHPAAGEEDLEEDPEEDCEDGEELEEEEEDTEEDNEAFDDVKQPNFDEEEDEEEDLEVPEEKEKSSRPGKAAQKKLRPLSSEEKELFGSYMQNTAAKEQIIHALDNITMASYTGNVILTGEEGMDIMTLAKNLIKEVQTTDSNFSGKIAKISGRSLNKKDMEQTLEKLSGGALIVQGAAALNKEAAEKMHKSLDQENRGIIILLSDTKKSMNKFLAENHILNECFNIRIDVEALDNDSLVEYGKKYAREQEHSIDELGVLALHTRISDMQTSDHAVTVGEVKNIVDEAIRHADRKTPAHFFDILLAKRYDEEDMIILREKDFV